MMCNIITQTLEVIGYSFQYFWRDARDILSTFLRDTQMVIVYIQLCIYDFMDYYHRYMILSLPKSVFGAPILKIQQYDEAESESESDSEDETEPMIRKFDIFVSRLEFIYKSNDIPPLMTRRSLNGAQLQPFIDNKGRFFVGHIQQYYPNLDTILIIYSKTPSDIDQIEDDDDESESFVKVIDVAKRYDIRNNQSCSFGVYL